MDLPALVLLVPITRVGRSQFLGRGEVVFVCVYNPKGKSIGGKSANCFGSWLAGLGHDLHKDAKLRQGQIAVAIGVGGDKGIDLWLRRGKHLCANVIGSGGE